ncbi:hypothetical protein LTR36_004564 [Oleoguttula mirabilis]|uniref:Uncharacterized protein n=1 Tax=Oleoguttula mirabilis TaxID=1507867 RepID=A0AAV9JFU3_9PEZI|nr:hypothetical protein LTR36_004564 [Oleoguttula mirabilis]
MTSLAAQGHGTGFLDLPPELRNQIYALREHGTALPKTNIWIYARKEASDFPFAHTAITHVSRQVRAEAISMLYRGMDVELDLLDAAGHENCKEWLDLMHPDAMAAITSFTISAHRPGCACASTCAIRVNIEAGRARLAVRSFGRRRCWVRNGGKTRIAARVTEVMRGVERMTKAVVLGVMEAVKAVACEEQQAVGEEEDRV